jgi:hypothetical protein
VTTPAKPTPGTPVPPAYPLCEMHDVEVFEVGTHRGRVYSEDDLDEMARNFDKFGPKGLDLLAPTAVLGHEADQSFLDRSDLPSAGTVTRMWRDGPKLRADFKDVPQPIAALVAAKAYRKPSIELYDEDRPFDAGDGKVYTDKIVRRVAFLGAEQPQVKTLADLPVPVFSYADKWVAAYRTPAGPCFAFSEVRPVTKADWIKKCRADQRYAKCFADGEGGQVTIDTKALLERIKAALPGVDQATLDSMSPEQLMGLALGTPPVAAATGGGGGGTKTEMADYPDRATMVQELVAAGQDATALDGMTDQDLQALYAQVTGKQFRDKGKPVPTPTPAATAAAKAFAEQQARQKDELDRLSRTNAELDAANKRAQERARKAKADETHAFCDKLVHEGRLLPAQRPTVERDLLAADDVDPCHKFGEAGKDVPVTAYELRRRELAAWPVVVKFGEKLKAGGPQADAEAEAAKVHTFAEANPTALKAAGTTAAKMVETFKKAREKDPTLTAQRFGIPAEFCR